MAAQETNARRFLGISSKLKTAFAYGGGLLAGVGLVTLGRKVLEYAIAQARKLGAERLHLETNRQLANAIHLYQSVGFRHVSPDQVIPSPYARANVFMALVL